MKNIAIFVSGSGEAAERIVKLFNEGNRVHTVLVVAENSAISIEERLKDEDVTVILVSDDEWPVQALKIADLLKENEVKLLVLDDFTLMLPDEIMETTDGEIIRVTSPELAPREVVAALEADLRKPVEVETAEVVEDGEQATPEREWADALKIQFTPPKIPTIPPQVPHEEQPVYTQPETPVDSGKYYTSYDRGNFSYQKNGDENTPMPSTYLIWSILVTVFCCFIPGIIAIIFSSMVSSKYFAGDIEGSRRASRQAEIWIIVSVVLGVIAATLYIPFMMIGG